MEQIQSGAPAPDPVAPPATDPSPAAPTTPAAPEPQAAPPGDNAPSAPAPTAEPGAETGGKKAPADGLQSLLAGEPDKTGGKSDSTGENDPEGAGEAFSVEIPEGFMADKDAVGILEAKVKDGVLSKEMAQELAGAHMQAIQRYQAHIIQLAQKQVDDWESRIKTDQTYGGARLERNVEAAKLMLQKYATPEMVETFKANGVLSHPDFFAMLVKLHGHVSEGESIGGAGGGSPAKDAAQVLFPGFK